MTTLPSPPTGLLSPRNEFATSRAVSILFNMARSVSDRSKIVYQSSGGGSWRRLEDEDAWEYARRHERESLRAAGAGAHARRACTRDVDRRAERRKAVDMAGDYSHSHSQAAGGRKCRHTSRRRVTGASVTRRATVASPSRRPLLPSSTAARLPRVARSFASCWACCPSAPNHVYQDAHHPGLQIMQVQHVRDEGGLLTVPTDRDQTQIEPFSPRHNVVVGRNGSGKSNFFAGECRREEPSFSSSRMLP